MEEVDNIIIESLRYLKCDIEENITSLKQFTPDMAVGAIVSCIEAITPGTNFPLKLPPSMSLRLKLATNIADHIKDLGFRGDMGYQTILYCNEVEIRRVLMFLVERLPREANVKGSDTELKGYVPKLVKSIEERVRQSLQAPWQPKLFLTQKAINHRGFNLRQDFGDCFPLHTEPLKIPKTQTEASEAMKQYWCHYVPDVTKQCEVDHLIPSLLFPATMHSSLNDLKYVSTNQTILNDDDASKLEINIPDQMKLTQIETESPIDDVALKLNAEIEASKELFKQLRNEYKNLLLQETQLLDEQNKEEASLKTTLIQLKTKSKTLTVVSKEENIQKLKDLVENGNERLIALANQWNEVQAPLIEEYRSLQEKVTKTETSIQQVEDKLQIARQQNRKLFSELKDKESLEEQLTSEFNQFNKNTTRSAYTRRILEIIGNIKKQNEEIDKILKDTKIVQIEINKLNGQMERSFTLSDEIIFRDAKSDETSRKAYKLLAGLHTTCGEVVNAITDLGLVERESRNLQEQVEIEEARETEAKLGRVQADLVQVQKEMASLLKQINK